MAATCATDVGFSLPTLFTPVQSLYRGNGLLQSSHKTDVRILSQSYCTLVNMSKVGRAPWTHMSNFLDISHCALNSLPLCSFMAFLWGHFSATIRSVSDSCSRRGRSLRSPQTLLIPRELCCTLLENPPRVCWIITTQCSVAALHTYRGRRKHCSVQLGAVAALLGASTDSRQAARQTPPQP